MSRKRAKQRRPQATNPIVTQLRQLRRRKVRDESGTFYIEGNRIVAQALQSAYQIERGVIAPALLLGERAQQTAQALRETGAPVTELSPAEFGAISFKENLQGLGAVVRTRWEGLEAVRPDPGLGWVALDNVGNSGNLGAILRTGDAVGAAGMILLGQTTDPYHPAAVRASMGAVFGQRLVRAGFAEFVAWKRANGYPVVGTSGQAALSYRAVTYPDPCILLMGSERLGLTEAQQAACDRVVHIPMVGSSDSLNLGVATSLVLYEIFHQRQQGNGTLT